jgi:hypothetical protein
MPNNVTTEYVGNSATPTTKQNYKWWTADQNSMFQSVFEVVNRIESQNSYQHGLNIKHARLFSDLELLGFASYRLAGSSRNNSLSNNRLTYNLVRSVISTASSKIAKNKPKPQFLTDKGDWTLQERAKKLTQYVEGIFYDCDLYPTAQKAFVDGCIFGTGGIKFFEKDGRISAEKVFIDEIRVDYVEGMLGKPKQIHQVKYLSRDLLAELYPDHKAEINSATSGLEAGDESVDDVIKVIESWRLGTYKEDKDGKASGTHGKHAISIDNATLFEEDYDKDYFPFVFFRWDNRVSGFFGSGLAEELAGIQLAVNKTLMNIQRAQHLVAVPRIAIETGSSVSPAQINNDIGAIIHYTGTAPRFDTPTGMNPEVYSHLKWLIQSGYEVSGISVLSATSQKPSGLDSGVALREFNDIESERFMLIGMRYEQIFLDAAKIIIDMSRDIYSHNPSLKVSVPGGGFISTIKWKDVDLRDDQFKMKAFPVSLLPSTPAGKLQKVQEMVQAGFIPQEQAIQLLDFPDIGAYESIETANLNLIQKTLTEMVETGEYNPPEPQMNLEQAIMYAHKYYLAGRVNNLAEDRLELLLRFIDDAERLNKIQEQSQQPVAELPVAPVPTAVPEAPMQSDLLPNVPL